jgi:WXG100 family type VII secretion target
MALKIMAVLSELDASANRLTANLEEFRTATDNTSKAADTVAAGWEGDSRDAFVAEQREAMQYYGEMSRLVQTFIADLREARRDYQTADTEGARILRSV